MTPMPATIRSWVTAIVLATAIAALAQNPLPQGLEVTAHIQLPHTTGSAKPHSGGLPPAVLWLLPLGPTLAIPAATPPRGGYVLLQKNKMFSPHLLVVPTGSVVLFPNADPFFHNVFSLFDGKRFDLGLYEAGKTKAVTFSREGVSYIFCNIHSEMSAVVISLSTPLYSIADGEGAFHLHDVPAGDYEMRLWVEGEQQTATDKLVRQVRVSPSNRNLGMIVLDSPPGSANHENKFGQPYDRDSGTVY